MSEMLLAPAILYPHMLWPFIGGLAQCVEICKVEIIYQNSWPTAKIIGISIHGTGAET